MAGTKFSGFATEDTTANTLIVGYDSNLSTNNQYTLAQLADGISPSITFPDTIFTANPPTPVPATQVIDVADNITFNHTAGATAACIWKTTSGYGNIAIIPAGLGGVGGGSSPGLYWDWTGYTNIIRTYTGSPGKNVELGHAGIATVSINPWTSFWLNTAGLTVASTSATTTGVQIRGGSDADTSKALLVENDSGTETFSVRDDGVVKISGQGYTELYDTANTTLTVNWNNSNIQELTSLTGSHTFTASNPQLGATYILTLGQTGAVTPTWTGVIWPAATAPTLSGAGKTDIITLICYDATGAGLYYGTSVLDYTP